MLRLIGKQRVKTINRTLSKTVSHINLLRTLIMHACNDAIQLCLSHIRAASFTITSEVSFFTNKSFFSFSEYGVNKVVTQFWKPTDAEESITMINIQITIPVPWGASLLLLAGCYSKMYQTLFWLCKGNILCRILSNMCLRGIFISVISYF